MIKNTICLTVAFVIIWIILVESITIWSVSTGIVVSLVCVLLCRRYLTGNKIGDVKFFRFFLYIFYLIGQMYWAAILAIKLILVGAKADVVKIRTKIKSDFLKVALANSITLVPGSVTLDLKDNRLTVMMLRDKNAKDEDLENAGKLMTEKLEKRLLKAQK